MQSQINEIKEQQAIDSKMLNEIHTALVGNELGTTGVITRLEKVETKATKNNKSIINIKSTSVLYGSGAATGVAAIWLAFKAWIATKFGG